MKTGEAPRANAITGGGREARCAVCSAPRHPVAELCKRCKKLVDRVDTRRKADKQARREALRAAWNGSAFCCYYTGVALVENDHRDPRYLTFDHRVPRNEHDLVVACSCINDMKSDLTESEFRNVVLQLAQKFNGGRFDENALRLKHWKR